MLTSAGTPAPQGPSPRPGAEGGAGRRSPSPGAGASRLGRGGMPSKCRKSGHCLSKTAGRNRHEHEIDLGECSVKSGLREFSWQKRGVEFNGLAKHRSRSNVDRWGCSTSVLGRRNSRKRTPLLRSARIQRAFGPGPREGPAPDPSPVGLGPADVSPHRRSPRPGFSAGEQAIFAQDLSFCGGPSPALDAFCPGEANQAWS